MNIKLKTMLLCATTVIATASASSAASNELIATTDATSKRGTSSVLALDFLSSGDATAFEFEVKAPKGAIVDTKYCVSELPPSHVGACQFNKDQGSVVVMVYSNSNTALPDGVISIGRLSFSGKTSGKATIEKLLVSSTEAKALDAKVSLSSEIK